MLSNGSKFKMPTIRIAEQLPESKIFELMRIFPIPADVNIKRLNQDLAFAVPGITFDNPHGTS